LVTEVKILIRRFQMPEAKSSQWAMAAPATLYVAGALCFGLFALLCGLVSAAAIPVMCAWLIAGAIAILICGIIELARNDILLGSIFLMFGALIALGGGMSFKAIVALPPEAIPAGLAQSGWVWVAIGIILFTSLPGAGKVSWSLFVFVLELGVALELLAIGLITGVGLGTGIMSIAGILLLIFGLYVLYASTVFITNTVYGAPKLPIGAPLFK
jgi:succinate-acetate transporter protein